MPIDANVNDFPIVLDYRNRKLICIGISQTGRPSLTNQRLFIKTTPGIGVLTNQRDLIIRFS